MYCTIYTLFIVYAVWVFVMFIVAYYVFMCVPWVFITCLYILYYTQDFGKVGVATLRDVSFRQSYGRDLDEALFRLQTFASTAIIGDLHQAWEIYQQIFKKIKAQISSLKVVELHHVSPALLQARQLSLAVPGTYTPFQSTISIQSISTSMEVSIVY